jgi:hypothetical protein
MPPGKALIAMRSNRIRQTAPVGGPTLAGRPTSTPADAIVTRSRAHRLCGEIGDCFSSMRNRLVKRVMRRAWTERRLTGSLHVPNAITLARALGHGKTRAIETTERVSELYSQPGRSSPAAARRQLERRLPGSRRTQSDLRRRPPRGRRRQFRRDEWRPNRRR